MYVRVNQDWADHDDIPRCREMQRKIHGLKPCCFVCDVRRDIIGNRLLTGRTVQKSTPLMMRSDIGNRGGHVWFFQLLNSLFSTPRDLSLPDDSPGVQMNLLHLSFRYPDLCGSDGIAEIDLQTSRAAA